jgi:RNA polymerase sigma-70 factor (ECF subfamily)
MLPTPLQPIVDDISLDETLVERARARDESAVRTLTRRYNQRLFRIARSILRNDAEAEDVVQETYVRAFTGLDRFRGEAGFGTWLTRIAMNEALGRLRRRQTTVAWPAEGVDGEGQLRAHILRFPAASSPADPETTMAQREMKDLLERAIDQLPETFRTAFVARIVEGMSVEETADLIGIRPETVKTRVHRARVRLRADIDKQCGPLLSGAFPFDGRRCERLTEAVIRRLGDLV